MFPSTPLLYMDENVTRLSSDLINAASDVNDNRKNLRNITKKVKTIKFNCYRNKTDLPFIPEDVSTITGNATSLNTPTTRAITSPKSYGL